MRGMIPSQFYKTMKVYNIEEVRHKVDNEFQKKQTELFEKWNVGFAFGGEQLNEYIEKQRSLGYEGKFTSLPKVCPGMIVRVDTALDFVKELASLHKEWKKAKRNAWNMDSYIEFSMWNHEVFYTGQWNNGNMMDDVRYYFPEAKDEDFKRVYYEVQNRTDGE